MFSSAVHWYVQHKFPGVNQITTDELDKQLCAQQLTNVANNLPLTERLSITTTKTFVVVDSRRKDEFEVSHIPNAKRVHFQSADESLLNFLTEESVKHESIYSEKANLNIVCYCSLGYRSSILAKRMTELIKNNSVLSRKDISVWNLEGSIFKWANESKQMTDLNEKTTTFAHPFSYTFCAFLQKQFWKWTPDAKDGD